MVVEGPEPVREAPGLVDDQMASVPPLLTPSVSK